MRRGPSGPRTLCNACGLRWYRQQKQKVVEDKPTPPVQAILFYPVLQHLPWVPLPLTNWAFQSLSWRTAAQAQNLARTGELNPDLSRLQMSFPPDPSRLHFEANYMDRTDS